MSDTNTQIYNNESTITTPQQQKHGTIIVFPIEEPQSLCQRKPLHYDDRDILLSLC